MLMIDIPDILIYDDEHSYTKIKKLGKGGFSECYQYKSNQTNNVYAVKAANVSKPEKQKMIVNEIKILRDLAHPHIIPLYRYKQIYETAYMFMKCCPNNSLAEYMKIKRIQCFKESIVKTWIWQLTDAVCYLHRHFIIHCDITLKNCLLDAKLNIQLCDFGLAIQCSSQNETVSKVHGTPNYIAPETLLNESISFSADIWAIGIVMYTLLFGKPPFEGLSTRDTYKQIKCDSLVIPESPCVSEHARDLLNKLLEKDPLKRIACEDIPFHPFFASHDFPEMFV